MEDSKSMVLPELLLEKVPEAAVMCIDIVTLRHLSGLLNPEDTLSVLSALVQVFDKCVTR